MWRLICNPPGYHSLDMLFLRALRLHMCGSACQFTNQEEEFENRYLDDKTSHGFSSEIYLKMNCLKCFTFIVKRACFVVIAFSKVFCFP